MSLAVELPAVDTGCPTLDNSADVEALHREFYSRLVRVCTQQLHDRSLAEDVAQDTILRALRFWSSYDIERPTWPWLKTIAMHLCLDARRLRSHEVCLETMPDRPEPTDRTERLLDEITVRGAMARLPERQRLALRLRYFDDRDRDASAEVLGVNVNAFDQLLNRARLRMARVIEPARAGTPLGLLLFPLRWLRQRVSRQARVGGGAAGTVAMGAFTTVPLAIAPLLAIVTGVTPATAAATYPAAHTFTTGPAATHRATNARPARIERRTALRKANATARPLNVATALGPTRANAKVSKRPLAPGEVDAYRVVVSTPTGDAVTVDGYANRYDYDLLCGLPNVECSHR
jgi:RNA polymerase sigma-70 factor (ECF subfamily)